MHYLDNAATTRVLPEAAEAAVHAMLEEFGNPSSLTAWVSRRHICSRTAAKRLPLRSAACPRKSISPPAARRARISACTARAHLNRHKEGRIIVTEIEHAATINTAKQLADSGLMWYSAPGRDRPHHAWRCWSEALTEDTVLLSCQLVNNEIGTGIAGRAARKAAQGQHPRRCSTSTRCRVFAACGPRRKSGTAT